MSRKIFIGSVIIHRTGTNPYNRTTDNPLRMGTERVKALRQFKETGKLPEGYAFWNDVEKEAITSPDQIDWTHLREAKP